MNNLIFLERSVIATFEDFSLNDFVGRSFGVYQGEPVHIKVWFHADIAGYIKEKIWHESQQMHVQDDGSIIFEAEVAGTDEIRFWIMDWGPRQSPHTCKKQGD